MDFSHTPYGDGERFDYGEAHTHYVEWLKGGVLWPCGFTASGPNYRSDANHLKLPDREEVSAFIVELDGISLVDRWEYADCERTEEDGVSTVRVLLRHREVPAEVRVCTKMDGSGCFSRWIELTNLADHPAALTRFAVLSGRL